ncbi:biliverdin-producing heme oxygenase [Pseudomonas tohonis]|uniref:biliverdin-producing heme oxygenase n=1 Tax=Pseudomonas tohonis TaxID=2725477 RepID=UPI0021D90064|nr:biliverdin-producing heme oxygenase [Pseudomonas tohonis]UXY51861.1 biliverdin-producing heme oxygenase [Pseudomonas tohonis]
MSLRQFLRDAGAHWHARVDCAYSAYCLESRSGYGDFLQAHARALLMLEPAMEAAGIERLLDDWPERRRREALCRDLQALHLPIPETAAVMLTADAGTLWGLAYVLEGSRLGSRLLASRVRQAGWPGAATALCYLGHGDGLPLWPGFLRRLEEGHGQLDPEALRTGVELGFRTFLAATRPPARPDVAAPVEVESDRHPTHCPRHESFSGPSRSRE